MQTRQHALKSFVHAGGSRHACFVLKALPAALALVFSQAGGAADIAGAAGLPLNGSVIAGAATGSVSGSQLTINQSSARAVLDWASFNIDAGKSVQFVQPGVASAVLNRVTGDANPSQILGSLSANGTVMLMNPNGVMFGIGSVVNVGSLIATSGNIDANNFINTGGALITGATGSIGNQGSITAASGGLVALVAPSVLNQGSIVATGGTIALAGATAATVSLNGGLYEFAISSGATGTSVSNAAGASLQGATLLLGVGDAAHLLSGVINLEGVQQASNAMVVNGGTVVLKSALQAPNVSGNANQVDVYDGARIQDAVQVSKTGSPGAGAAVNVHGGSYQEQVVLNKANMTLTGSNGARIVVPADPGQLNGISIQANHVSVSGMEIAGPVNLPYLDYTWGSSIPRGIAVASGVTDFTISNNNIHDVRNGILIDGRNTGSVMGNRIDNTKSAISVQYTDGSGITIAGNTQGPLGNEWGLNLHLNGYWDGAAIHTNPIAAAPTLAWQQRLLDLSAANAGWSVQDQGYTSSNRTQVAVATTGSAGNQGSLLTPINTIQGGVNAVVVGGTVNVAAGTYAESVSIGKALTLQGAGAGRSVVEPVSGDGVAISGNIGANATLLIDGFTFRNAPGSGVSVASNTVLGQLTVRNSDFRNNSYYGFSANGSATGGIPGLASVALLDSTFEGNGAPPAGATALGLGDIQFNYFNGNATLKNLHITGNSEHTGIHFRGYHNAVGGGVHDAGTVVFDSITLDGSFRRPSSTVGTWNPGGPGYAIHLFEYGSVANVSFNNVSINTTVGHGLGVEGLGSTLNIGNTRFGLPDTSITGSGSNPTASLNILVGTNAQNNVKTNVNATAATFTGAASGFDIEDRVGHALDAAGVGLVTWNAGNVYVTQKSGSVQRGVDAVLEGGTVNVAAGTYAGGVVINKALTLDGAGVGQTLLQSATAGSGDAVTINNASNVTLSDFSIANYLYGLRINGTSNNVTVNRLAFNNNTYGVRNGTGTRADNFRMLNSSITGGLVGFQTYNGYQMVGGVPVATGSFANALFENVTVDGPSFKGFYFETADNLTLRNVTVSNSGNYGDPVSMRYGSAIDVNLKYGAFGSLTFDNVVVKNSGYSSNDPTRAAVVIKTRGLPGDTAYSAAPASLQAVNIIGGSLEGASGTGLRIETLSNGNGSDGRTAVTISGGTQFKNNGQDIVVENNNVDARGAVFVGAADGFAIEDRVTHALDATGRGLVTWNANNVYVTPSSGSIQRGVDASSVGGTVNVAAGSYAEDVMVNRPYNLLFNASTLHSLTLNAGAAGSGIAGMVTADGVGGFLFNAPIRLLGDTTLATLGADITLTGDIQNAGADARTLRLLAGAGGSRGNVFLATGGTQANALGAFEVRANRFSLLDTLWVQGYQVNALGNVALSGHTLRAQDPTAANSLNAGGDVSGSTISLGSVSVVSGGNIVANIAGTDVAVAAAGNLNVVVTASHSAAFSAGGNAQVAGSAPAMQINAPSGSVSGSFGQVTNTGGGLVNVNGKPQGNQTLSANTENNRVVPANAPADPAAPADARGLLLAQSDAGLPWSTPGAVGEAMDGGQAVELDLSPRHEREKKERQ